jgi:hypothetical protein
VSPSPTQNTIGARQTTSFTTAEGHFYSAEAAAKNAARKIRQKFSRIHRPKTG